MRVAAYRDREAVSNAALTRASAVGIWATFYGILEINSCFCHKQLTM